MLKIKLNYHDRSNRVWSMTKTRQDNGVTNCTGAIYVEIGIEVSWSIVQVYSMSNMKLNFHDRLIRVLCITKT